MTVLGNVVQTSERHRRAISLRRAKEVARRSGREGLPSRLCMKMRDDAQHSDSSRNLYMMQMCLSLTAIGTPSHPGPTRSL